MPNIRNKLQKIPGVVYTGAGAGEAFLVGKKLGEANLNEFVNIGLTVGVPAALTKFALPSKFVPTLLGGALGTALRMLTKKKTTEPAIVTTTTQVAATMPVAYTPTAPPVQAEPTYAPPPPPPEPVSMTTFPVATPVETLTEADVERQIQEKFFAWMSAVSVPPGAFFAYGGTVPPPGYLMLNGDSIGCPGSGATHEDEGLRALFEVWRDVLPNTGAEIFDAGDIVVLSDSQGLFMLGRTADGTGSVLGETGGTLDHVHDMDITTSRVTNGTG